MALAFSRIPWLAAGLALVLVLWSQGAQAATLRERDIVEFVCDQVAQRYQVGRDRVEIEWEGPGLATLLRGPLPKGTVDLAIQGQPRMLGRSAIPVALTLDGKRYRTVYPRMAIKVWQDVWVAGDRIRRGEIFGAGLAKAERRSLETVMGSAPSSLKGLTGAVAKREIPRGSVLVAEMFDMPPLVRNGSVVKVRLVSGDLVIFTSGQAIGNGTYGQLIKITNPDTRRDYVARVTGNDEVEITLEEAP